LKDSKTEVLLIGMPFAYFSKPFIGISLLKAGLERINVSCKIRYFSLKFVETHISPVLNNLIANNYPNAMCLLGDWIFSEEKTGNDYIGDILKGKSEEYSGIKVPEYIIGEIINAKNNVKVFLEECLEEVLHYKPAIVGFTNNYGQQRACLALARRIKEAAPEVFIVFGGPNCEGIMGAELIRQFPFIDAIVSGEGDIVFPKIVKNILGKKSVSQLQGVYTQDNISHIFSGGNFLNAEPVTDMDSIPCPDYKDFMEAWEKSSFSKKKEILENIQLMPMLLFETSRGCWWGQKKRCTFCGYGQNIHFRSKTPERALEEFNYLTGHYPGFPVVNVDNILDMSYFKEFLSKIESNLLILHHVKSNLSKEQLQLVKDKVQPHLQPGIESLSTPVLKLMRKGVSALQNIQFLKWAHELDIHLSWNLLSGFPGELPESYGEMAELLPLLSHLQPPGECNKIYLTRFSPYFEKGEEFGLSDILPYHAYYYVYPEISSEALSNLAFYFTFKYREPRDVNTYVKPVFEKFKEWINNYITSSLTYKEYRYQLVVTDTRPIAKQTLTVLSELESYVFLACDKIQTLDEIKKLLERETGREFSCSEAEKIIQPLLKRGFMIKENNKYLALAVKTKM